MGMQSMDIDKDTVGFLRRTKTSAPQDLKEHFSKFEDLHDKKLWHQLTLALENFAGLSGAGPFLMPLYDNFIVEWEKKMNQLSLVQFSTKAARELKDPKKALEFLTKQTKKLAEKPAAKDAYVLASMEAAHYKLIVGDYEGCKKAVDECEKILEDLPGVDSTINAGFYRVSADYYKTKAAYPKYYKNALLFLSSVPLDSLTEQDKVDRAYELAISALLGEGVYNLGELLMHPILDSLNTPKFSWLRDLLFTFNTGNIMAFEKLSSSPPFLSQPLLTNSLPFLREKLCLMTLIELVFTKSKAARAKISFKEISQVCKVGEAEVEILVMKGMSLGVLRGGIDQVEALVQVSWVQPRVLDKAQIKGMMDRLAEWRDKVSERVGALENEEGAAELFLQA